MKTIMWGNMHQILRPNIQEKEQNWVTLFKVTIHVKMVLNEKKMWGHLL